MRLPAAPHVWAYCQSSAKKDIQSDSASHCSNRPAGEQKRKRRRCTETCRAHRPDNPLVPDGRERNWWCLSPSHIHYCTVPERKPETEEKWSRWFQAFRTATRHSRCVQQLQRLVPHWLSMNGSKRNSPRTKYRWASARANKRAGGSKLSPVKLECPCKHGNTESQWAPECISTKRPKKLALMQGPRKQRRDDLLKGASKSILHARMRGRNSRPKA